MSKLRVGVLRGGESSEYEVSLKTGASVLKHLARDKFEPQDIFIDREGRWHLAGLPAWPEDVAEEVDVFFNALHGEYGEDGQIQRLLNNLSKPFTGPEEIPAMAAMNKVTTKNLLSRAGIKTPSGMVIIARANNRESAKQVFNKLSPPWVVKPIDRGSSIGLSLAKSFDDLLAAIERAANFTEQILIEQYIAGKEGTVGVIDNFRGQPYYSLLPSGHERLTGEEKALLGELAILAHETLGLRHYSEAGFITTPRGPYLLEVDALPSLTADSTFSPALAAIGANYHDFLTHIIEQALK
ncbi:MAG: ATP-grasp domain-containing protein [bacterium]|nr:ATP-grasp domain-containing protein [bacterium]